MYGNGDSFKVPLVSGVGKVNGVMSVSDAMFRERIRQDVQERLKKFTFEENLAIAFTPLIITELAWKYAFKVIEGAARERIESTKKLCRTLRFVRDTFINEYRKDLDLPHMKRIQDSALDFMEQCTMDLMLLWFSVNNDIKRSYPEIDYVDIRTDAYIALVVLDVLEEHNKRMDEMIKERVGSSTPYRNRLNDALRQGMEAFIYPMNLERSQNVLNSMKIIHKNLSRIRYDINK